MNTIEAKIQNDLTLAIKSKDLKKANIIRGIKSAFALFKTSPDGKKEPEDSDLLQIIQKLVEKRKKTGDLYKKKGRPDLAESEYAESEVISTYLPKMLSEEEITKVVDETITKLGATTMKDMGKVMSSITKAYAGQVDAAVVSKMVKGKLS